MRRKAQSEKPDGRKRWNKEEVAPRKRLRFLDGVKDIDLNDYDLLRRFMSDHGKILASRLTGASAKQQRQIRRAIRRARNVGLLA